MASILVVDDEEVILSFLETVLRREGHDVQTSADGVDAKAKLEEQTFDIVISDYLMAPVCGLELVRYIRSEFPDTQVILISGYCQLSEAVELFKAGAFDYLPKPVKIESLLETIRLALEYQKASSGHVNYAHNRFRYSAGGVLVESPKMAHIAKLVECIAPTAMPVLIRGEPGTGRDTIAQSLHNLSLHPMTYYRPVDCGKMSEEDFEELLSLAGIVESTERPLKGTLYLKEIHELSFDLQDRIVKTFHIAGNHLRLIASTSSLLSPQENATRLSSKLRVLFSHAPIVIPPLRDRREDIMPLAYFFLKRAIDDPVFEPEIEHSVAFMLEHHHWPGNNHELREAMESASLSMSENLLTLDDLPPDLVKQVDMTNIAPIQTNKRDLLRGRCLKQYMRSQCKQAFAEPKVT